MEAYIVGIVIWFFAWGIAGLIDCNQRDNPTGGFWWGGLLGGSARVIQQPALVRDAAMNVPIDEYGAACIDLDAPTLPAYSIRARRGADGGNVACQPRLLAGSRYSHNDGRNPGVVETQGMPRANAGRRGGGELNIVSFTDDRAQLLARIGELDAKVAALQDQEERVTIALAQSDIGVFDWDLDNQTVYVSPTLQEMLGHDGDSMPPDPADWIGYLHPNDRYQAQADLREALMYGKETFRGLYRVLPKNGGQGVFLFRAVFTRHSRAAGGDAFRALGTAVDVTNVL